jgi:G3E family GTPase
VKGPPGLGGFCYDAARLYGTKEAFIMSTPGWILALDDPSRAAPLLRALPWEGPRVLWLLDEPPEGLPSEVSVVLTQEEGCSCCQAREQLQAQIAQAGQGASALVVVCGQAQAPMPLIQAMAWPGGPVALKSVVVQVQGRPWEDARSLQEVGHDGPQAQRLRAEVATDWLEVADVFWVEPGAQERRLLAGLNPEAQVIASPQALWGVETFSLGAVMQRPGWLRALRASAPAQSWHLFKAPRPFHPARLKAVMDAQWPGLVRARGFLWLATQMKFVMQWSRAGDAWTLSPSGIWWADRPEDRRPRSGAMGRRLQEVWREPWGDRRQELALLTDQDPTPLLEKLQAALLDDEEMSLGQLGWRYLYNPLRALDARGVASGPWSAALADPELSEVADAVHFPQEGPRGGT